MNQVGFGILSLLFTTHKKLEFQMKKNMKRLLLTKRRSAAGADKVLFSHLIKKNWYTPFCGVHVFRLVHLSENLGVYLSVLTAGRVTG
jgi:hypothetical protein